MANRDFKKIERIMKDFSLGVGEGGSTSNWAIKYGELNGKHVDVESLISFLSKIGYDENTTLGELPGLIARFNQGDVILYWFPYECGDGEIRFNIGGLTTVNFTGKYETDKAFQALREFKNEIESKTYNISKWNYDELLFSIIFEKDGSIKTSSFDEMNFFKTTN